MKMVLYELQRILRARLLPLTLLFLIAALLAFALNEYGPRYAGASRLTLELGEIARTSTSISALSADICEACTPPDSDQIVSAVQFAVDSAFFWERVANGVLAANGGEIPDLPSNLFNRSSERALSSVDTGAQPDRDAAARLAQALRGSVTMELVNADGDLEITLHRADRETAVLVFQALDHTVRTFIVEEITQHLQRELASSEAEIALLREFHGTGASSVPTLGLDDGAVGRAELATVLPHLRAASSDLRDVLHLEAILRGERPERAILVRVTRDLLPGLAAAVSDYTAGTIDEEALREEIDDRGTAIATLRDRLAAEVEARRTEASLLFDEVQVRSALALSERSLARDAFEAARDESRLAGQIGALRETIDRVQSAILSTSRFAQFQYVSGARAATVIGLLAALAYFLWYLVQQFGIRTITSTGEVRELSVPVLGEVPAQEGFSTPIASEGEARDNYIMARAMRNIRSAILASLTKTDNITILITSSVMDEGKSFIARELAWAFSALENRRVLLIAADYRRIVPMEGLSKTPKHTLADLMLGTNPDDEIDLMVPELGFEYLPARPIDLDPSDLLSSPRFDQLMENLREEFDVIIIDGPPVLPVPDSVNLARCVDMTIFAVRHDSTLVSKVIEGLTRLRMAGVKPISAVLSRTRHKDEDHDGYLAYISNPD